MQTCVPVNDCAIKWNPNPNGNNVFVCVYVSMEKLCDKLMKMRITHVLSPVATMTLATRLRLG